MPNKARLLSREEAAEFLGLQPQTLAVWASNGRHGLAFVKIGRLAKYRQCDLDEFVERNRATHTGQLAEV